MIHLQNMSKGAVANKLIELTTVVLNLLFTILYLNGNPWCYLFGILGPMAFIILCYRNKLYAEPILQLCYIVFAIYGWMNLSEQWQIVHWSSSRHIPFLISGMVISLTSGFLLQKFTQAKLPYVDSVITVFGIVATWMMVNYVHENWLYFMFINALSIYVYLKRKIFFGAALFVLYLLMSVDGYFELKIFYS